MVRLATEIVAPVEGLEVVIDPPLAMTRSPAPVILKASLNAIGDDIVQVPERVPLSQIFV